MTGRGFKWRMLALALPANVLSVGVVAAYLTTLLDFSRAVWVGFAWVVLGWFVVFQAVAQKQQERLQGPVARWLDADATGSASEEQTLDALASAVDCPRRTLVMGYTLWPLGGLAVALTMKALFAAFQWNDLVVMVAATLSGGALSSLLLAFLFKRFMEPQRARLARAVLDPEARAAAAPRLPIAWKLQGTVLVTAVVPVLFAAFVAQRSARQPLLAYVHGLQDTWLARAVDQLGDGGDPARLGAVPGSEAVGSWALLGAGSGAPLVGDPALARATADLRGDAGAASGWSVVSGGVVSWRRVGDTDRILSVGLPPEALASANGGTSLFLLALLVSALAVAIGVAWLVAQDLGRSIAALRAEADCIASGDLSRPQVFESEDELGELGRAFDRMRQALRETVGRVAQAADRVEAATTDMAAVGSAVAGAAAEQERAVSHTRQSTESVREEAAGITASAQELSASVEESSSSILEMGAAGEELNQTASVLSGKVDEVSTSIEQMIRGVAEMARNVEGLSDAAIETQSSIQEMAGSMREVNANAAETARLSAQVVTVAEGGRERVQETISGMEAIRDATDTVEQVIRGLGERAKEIGAIVDVIDDVADETNLLALNAAIIAAQAGEHGRAFSVVADEIKELADRVMSSTKEIGGLIRSVQSESAAAISAIERGSESVWVGVERSAQAGESLEAITRTARESGQRIGEIVQAVQEQARAAAHVQQLMERVRSSVEQLRGATREQEQGNEVVLSGTATMREVAQQVHRTTEEQARGGNQIRAGIEVVRQAVERIYQALQDQAAAYQQSAQSMGRVSAAARANHESAGQMERSTEDLRAAAGWLREEIGRFRL